MEEDRTRAERLFAKTIAAVVELDPAVFEPEAAFEVPLHRGAIDIFRRCAEGKTVLALDADYADSLMRLLREGASDAKEILTSFYARKENTVRARAALAVIEDPTRPPEEKASVVAGVWAPEIEMNEEDILRRWRLTDVRANPEPIRPTEVIIQLNGLYTLPESSGDRSRGLLDDPGRKIADYDHPVHLFERDENHELINCLRELEEDLVFEKEKGVLPGDYRVPVLLSVSVTHENLDGPCGEWIHERVRNLELKHIRIIVLTEKAVDKIKRELLGADIGVYSVFGRYGVHFNALKYTQLLLEQAWGIRAGFKLDTDEGIRSRDLYKATGKTWFQTLCHELWGGTALDWRGRRVDLAFNLGEYVNEKDIDRLGYVKAMREPDVKLPESHVHADIFFDKGYAHAKGTALYNRFTELEDHISHTVVKGGGYGITNAGLRSHVPFTFSLVGRAEDQQFYFSGLASGARGIFHPDLRIAHYKGKVADSESKTEVTRFLGDMYRLIIFEHLAKSAGVKEDIDPMPGVFAGELARAQAFFHLLYRAVRYFNAGKSDEAEELLRGWKELNGLIDAIDSGEIARQLARERDEWHAFVRTADTIDPELTRRAFENLSSLSE